MYLIGFLFLTFGSYIKKRWFVYLILCKCPSITFMNWELCSQFYKFYLNSNIIVYNFFKCCLIRTCIASVQFVIMWCELAGTHAVKVRLSDYFWTLRGWIWFRNTVKLENGSHFKQYNADDKTSEPNFTQQYCLVLDIDKWTDFVCWFNYNTISTVFFILMRKTYHSL